MAETSAPTPAEIPPWSRHLREGEIWSIAIFNRDRLVGLLPAFLQSTRPSGERTLRFLGSGVSDYLDLLYESKECDRVLAALDGYLSESRDCWDLCDFHQLRPTSPWIGRHQTAGIPVTLHEQEPCPVLNLPMNLEDLAQTIPKRQLDNCRYYWRRANRSGRIEIEQANSSNLDSILQILFDLHAARWKSRGAEGALSDEAVRSFHREASRELLGVGIWRGYVLRLESQPLAVLAGFLHRRRFYYYLSGFDPRFVSLSPGTLVLHCAIEQAVREDAQQFDFLRGRESYKYLWGARDTRTSQLQLKSIPRVENGHDG
jgi:CelD/BcsL family acetyltransferase involved in cellulose biosynthesis